MELSKAQQVWVSKKPLKRNQTSKYWTQKLQMPLHLLLRSLAHHHHSCVSHIPPLLYLRLLRSSVATAAGDPATTAISPSTTRVGWIGTGVMGRSMAAHLIRAGYALTVFNCTPLKADPLIAMGACLADSPRAVAACSDVVFSIVGYPSDVRHVLLDPSSGVLAAAESKSCASIDAPVSGGNRGAKNGTLAIFAGGDESFIKILNPLFSLLGKVTFMGGLGSGQFAKLANQVTIASTIVGLVEGMVFAHRAGLDVELFLGAIATGAAGSRSLDLYGSRILKRDFEPGFFVNHFVKDLGICLKECQSLGLALPGLALAQQLYLSLKAHGEGNLGTQALFLALERLNNVSLDSSGSVSGAPTS